eukprot:Protomagalhaensia_wolfi_Nauph_80__502@NODE_1283_length_1613_cov_11_498094_g990_i0_p1_GENE_NODE_1283_length_1613_cov_11_498094_g990_i0NODE_1283_length_1613_cov_11_498094_g990_i0_p1_ORF_typecomplete_len522_score114_74GFO_IDH_MocA/PF01408_22/2_8e07ST7/PF04184_12/0_078ST7/PF04184_12/2_5e02TPR_MalT/PF17874_1/0_016TPR_15/PF13429_6/0_046TPR_15/PF13429_6/1_3e04OCD_Mu_crystall/PF02423_15/0_064TPR_12/PF13424_6/0_21ANAPC3/PF12895_7/0_22Coatomer_E/PF04733_14/0_15ANAPC5/PF12862_7/1_7e02ANAPC5/PF12862_7/0_44T
MLDDLREIYANWFKLRKEDDLPETLAHMCVKLGRVRDAIYYFHEFIKYCPGQVSAGTLTNLAGCLNAIQEFDEAHSRITECIQKWPDFEPARSIKTHIEMSRRVRRLAVIGCGSFASDLCHFFAKHATLKVVALFDFNTESAKKFKLLHQLREAEICGTWQRDICSETDITDVIVNVNMPLWKLFLPALWKSGKNIWSEKTVGVSINELKDLIAHFDNLNKDRINEGLLPLTWHVSNRESVDSFVTPQLLGACQNQLKSISISNRILASRDIPASADGRSVALRRDLIRSLSLCCKLTGTVLKQVSCNEVKDEEGRPAVLTGWAWLACRSGTGEHLATFNMAIVLSGSPGFCGVFQGSGVTVTLRTATCYWKTLTRVHETGIETKKSFMSSPIQDSVNAFLTGVHAIETGESTSMGQRSKELLMGLIEDLSLCAGIDRSIERRGGVVGFQKRAVSETKAKKELGGQKVLIKV